MGLRYRKSVKLGGLRINFSKSGVGYSYGVKGLRYTKTAKGKDRITASIPGTGVSYVSESGEKRKSKNAAEKYQPIQEPVKNIKMPLALKILAVICGSCFAAYYYFGQGQEISIAIASGALMGALGYLGICVLYGAVTGIAKSVFHKDILPKNNKKAVEISESDQKQVSDEAEPSKKVERKNKGRSIVRIPGHYTVVDTETTGLSPQTDRLIEIAAIRVRDGKEVARFETLVDPERDLSDEIVELTGITNAELEDAPDQEDALQQFSEFLKDDIIVAHNANFDVNFLYDSMVRCGMKPIENNFVDTLRLAKCVRPGLRNYKLATLSREYRIPQPTAHRALADCETTFAVLQRLADDAAAQGIDFKQVQKKGYTSRSRVAGITAEPGHENPASPLYEKYCVLTGELNSMTRQEAAQTIVAIGGHCTDRVTKKTDYLITGQNEYYSDSLERKTINRKKAEELMEQGGTIQIITEDAFLEMLRQ